MIKCYPASAVEEKIRKKAAELNLPITQYLAPFLLEIAEGRIIMHAGPPPAAQVVHKPAA